MDKIASDATVVMNDGSRVQPSAGAAAWRPRALAALALLAAAITLALQAWLGPVTIYAPGLEAKRLMLHQAIVANAPPPGGWAAVGAASQNIRVTAVYAAQMLHKASGIDILRAYMVLDTVFLFTALMGFALYLKRWMEPVWCLVGMLYFAAILPLSYFQHAFQPWDRMLLLTWLLLLAAIRGAHFWAALFGLGVAMTIKFDTALIALLYGMTYLSRNRFVRTLAECAGLVFVAWAVLALLKWALPAPAEPARFSLSLASAQIAMNLQDFVVLNLRHPVLLAWAPLAFLALWGLQRRSRFLIAGVAFASVLSVVWASFTVYAEMRAQMPLLFLLLPPALLTLREWLAPPNSAHRLPGLRQP